MKTRSTHIVQQYVFELTTNRQNAGLAWEKQAYQFAQEIMVPGLEQCFLSVDHVDRQVIIDKLEIDLGTFLPSTFHKEAIKRLIPLISDQLEEICDVNEVPKWEPDPQDKMDESQGGEKNKCSIVKLSPSHALYLVFVNFLNQGRFPWWYEKPDGSSKMTEQFNLKWVHTLKQKEKEALKETLISVKDARIRLADSFEKEWIGEFLQVIGMSGKEALDHWSVFIPALLPIYERRSYLHQHFWTSWMISSGNSGSHSYLRSFLELAAEGDHRLRNKLIKAVQEATKKKVKDPALSESAKSILAYLKTMINTGQDRDKINTSGKTDYLLDAARIDDSNYLGTQGNVRDIREEITGKGIPEKPDPKITDPGDLLINGEEDTLYVEGAGLVLLHPFLQELFKENRLWIGNRWESNTSPLKAIRLLSYLTFGERVVYENQLLLHKILSGLEVSSVLSATILLRDEEKESCEELLRAVIEHWKALRNTSPEGLREGFMQREGKLIISKTGFNLHIGSRTEDILLSRIPWGFGMIKLPWMEHAMHVKWI